MRNQAAARDLAIAGIASRQHGVVTAVQLATAGIDKAAVLRRARAGRLHRVHRGVYAVGHSGLSQEGRWMAAVLAYPEGAVLSHQSAAALWSMLSPRAGPVDVTVADRGGRPGRRGLLLHRSRSLTPSVTTHRNSIPVTTAARTINDLRGTIPMWQLRRAVREAAVLDLDIGEAAEADRTRSELERGFLRLCRLHRLPTPAVNTQIGRFVVDFLWPEQRLIVETDGYRYHRGRQAFEDDRARDVGLLIAGFEVIRFTYRQITYEPAQVAAALRALL